MVNQISQGRHPKEKYCVSLMIRKEGLLILNQPESERYGYT